MLLTFKIISSLFMTCILGFQIKNTIDDMEEFEEEKAKPSEIVIDCIILLFTVITMITIWF